MKYDLSVVIPARNEMFLAQTIENILKNIEGKTQIIVGLDGTWAEPPIKDHPDLVILHYGESIGQRAITNQCVKLSKAKYIMKIDAHCKVDKGFDVKMMNDMQDDWTMVPIMYNLHAFDWVCKNGHRRYQGPSGPCKECGEPTEMDILWKEKHNPESTSYRFDRDLHFQYFQEYKKKQIGDLVETMSLQGSCFMLTRDKYWELDICDEGHGGWGQQGTEVAAKTWLSGGRVVVNKKTWYAHMFRTQGGDFSFPYKLTGRDVAKARQHSKDLFLNGKWDKAIHPLSWLVDKFSPVPDWCQTRGILYYTDNQLNMKMARTCRKQLEQTGLPITSVSLKPMNFGKNIYLPLQRSRETMFKQILAGLEAMTEDVVYLCEHDVIYHPSHFDFIPPKKDIFYYNINNWRVREDGFAVYFDHKSTSQVCAYRELLIEEYKKRVSKPYSGGGYEPGTRSIRRGGYSDNRSEYFKSNEPNIDIRHSNNLTENRWSPDKFRDKTTCQNWKESDISKFWAKDIFYNIVPENK